MVVEHRTAYLREALKIGRLQEDLETIIHDDRKHINPNINLSFYTQEDVVKEAEYILGLFMEGGTVSNEAYIGEHGEEAQKDAVKQVRQLRKYIKKWRAY